MSRRTVAGRNWGAVRKMRLVLAIVLTVIGIVWARSLYHVSRAAFDRESDPVIFTIVTALLLFPGVLAAYCGIGLIFKSIWKDR